MRRVLDDDSAHEQELTPFTDIFITCENSAVCDVLLSLINHSDGLDLHFSNYLESSQRDNGR